MVRQNEMNDRGSRPVPDPTLLTTQQLIREISQARELSDKAMEGVYQVIAQLRAELDKIPNTITEKVKALSDLHDERFRSIQTRFSERDTLREQTLKDSKSAVEAALQSAKEAVTKSEASFTKQIEQLGELIRTAIAGLNDKIDDARTRVTSIEQRKEGGSMMVALIVSLVVAAVAVGGLMLHLTQSGPQQPVVVVPSTTSTQSSIKTP